MSLDAPDRVLQHIAHLAGLQMSKARKYKLVPLLVPSAVQRDRVEMWIQPHVGSRPLYSGDRASPRTDGALLRRSADIEGLHRVPVRNPDIRGPLSVYYYDHFSEALAARGVNEASLPKVPALSGGNADLLEYEALNLADGRRSLSNIRDILTGRYAPVPIAFVAATFERWTQAGIVTLR